MRCHLAWLITGVIVALALLASLWWRWLHVD
jgi:hypothetical protein